MVKVEHAYDASSIKILEGLDAVRMRPGMYIGSTDRHGLHHLVYEIVDNSVDEALAGHCTEIEVVLEKNGFCTVTDNGRGIPIGMHEKAKIPAVEVVLTTLHAGGKFDKEGYKVSGGLHGVGASVVNALSETMKVEIHRDGKVYNNTYKRGIPEKKEGNTKEEPKQKSTGTIISFLPDSKIFETLDFSFEVLSTRLREMSFLNKGLKITFTDTRGKTDKTEVYEFAGGLVEYIKHIDENKDPLFPKPIYIHKEKDDVDVEVALHYCKDFYDESVLSFANNIRTREGGTHLSGFRTALTRSINTFAKKYELIKKVEDMLTGADVREGLTVIISVKVPNPQFEGQTKAKLGNSEIKGIVDSIVDEGLSNAFEQNPTIGRAIVNKCIMALRVRNAARNAQDLARRKSALEGSSLPGKLADCINRDASKCEVYIVEGDSAGGSAKQGRDRNFQAILPLKGKILNVEKARLDKILENEELRNLISAIGPEVIDKLAIRSDKDEEADLSAGTEAIDVNEQERLLQFLRYHKIIIMTDADVDGAHIRTLLLTFFYRYAKKVIEAGCLYVAQPPLYLVKKGKQLTYAYSDEEKEKIVAGMGKDASLHVQRYKGLGEMNPEQLWSTTMDPKTRSLLRVELDDAVRADEIFTILMGSEVEPRKKFIQEHATSVKWLDI